MDFDRFGVKSLIRKDTNNMFEIHTVLDNLERGEWYKTTNILGTISNVLRIQQ
jgi:hypothetical protein